MLQGAEDCGKLPSNASIMASGFKILFLSVCLMLHNAAAFQHTLCQIMDSERDSLRFYYLGKKYENKIEHFGCKQTYSPEDTLMV